MFVFYTTADYINFKLDIPSQSGPCPGHQPTWCRTS